MTKPLTEGARGLRGVKSGNQSSLELAVHGDLESESAQNILDAKSSALTPLEVLEEGKRAKERGTKIFHARDYNSARGELTIATRIVDHEIRGDARADGSLFKEFV